MEQSRGGARDGDGLGATVTEDLASGGQRS